MCNDCVWGDTSHYDDYGTENIIPCRNGIE